MPPERSNFSPKSPYLREVPDPNEQPPAYPGHPDSERSGFSNSTIDRGSFSFGDRPNPHDFDRMLSGYMWSGGLARSVDVTQRLEERLDASMFSIERLVATHAIFGFEWRGSLWVPMFQFDRSEMYVKPQSRRVLKELQGIFDGWTIACWFLDPNLWLKGRRPVDLIDTNPAAVLAAADGDRFIATNALGPSH